MALSRRGARQTRPANYPKGMPAFRDLGCYVVLCAVGITSCGKSQLSLSDSEASREINAQFYPGSQLPPTRFEARKDIRVPVDEIWTRYGRYLHVSPTALVPIGSPRSEGNGRVLTMYQQVHLGYPVEGYGYFVSAEKGMFRAAHGKYATNLPGSVPSLISETAALDIVVKTLKLNGPPPWVTDHITKHAPKGMLTFMSPPTEPPREEFVLTWEFTFAGTGVSLAEMAINAVTGAVVWVYSGGVE